MSLRLYWSPTSITGQLADLGEEPDGRRLARLLRSWRAESGRRLASLPRTRIIRVLDEALARWQEKDSPFLRECTRELAAKTGWAEEMLEHGLRAMLDAWREPHMTLLLERALGERPGKHTIARGPMLLCVLLSGNVPVIGVPELLRALLLRSPVVARLSARETVTLPTFVRTLAELEPNLAEAVLLLHWPREAVEVFRSVFAASEDIVFYGGRRAHEALISLCPPTASWHVHGPKVSFAWVDRPPAGESEADFLGRSARAAAQQIAYFDQLGCLSPQIVFVREVEPGRGRRFARELSQAMEEREKMWPRRRLTPEEARRIQALRQRLLFAGWAQTESAETVRLWQSADSTAWTVAYDPRPECDLSPGNRFVFVKPARAPDDLHALLADWSGYLSTLGIAGQAEPVAIETWASLGFVRFCPLERMQSPPADWHHDGRSGAGRLLHRIDWER